MNNDEFDWSSGSGIFGLASMTFAVFAAITTAFNVPAELFAVICIASLLCYGLMYANTKCNRSL